MCLYLIRLLQKTPRVIPNNIKFETDRSVSSESREMNLNIQGEHKLFLQIYLRIKHYEKREAHSFAHHLRYIQCFTEYLVCGSNPALKGKVKCTLVQALRLCTGCTAHRKSRSIALPFHDHGTRRGGGQRHALAALYPQKRPGTHCTGGWVGPRAGLDRCGKSRPQRDFFFFCIRSPE